jgi:hypothetical protein
MAATQEDKLQIAPKNLLRRHPAGGFAAYPKKRRQDAGATKSQLHLR